MAIRSRKSGDAPAYAVVAALNATVESLVGSAVHYSITEDPLLGDDFRNPSQTNAQIDSADATDEATLVTLVNEIVDVYGLHIADDLAHKVADTDNAVTNADATDAATAATLITEVKGNYNTHRASTTFHANADSTNEVTNADATDQATAITLANEVKADINAHVIDAAGTMVRLIDA